MLFSRVATFFAFIFTLGILAVAKPVELENRASDASVENVVATLQSKTNTILPQIKSAAASNGASAATIEPLINELVTAINTAHTSVTQFGLKKRQTEEDIATSVAGIVTNIAETFKGIPILGLPGLLVSVDVALQELLSGLDVVVVGLGATLSGLLAGVGGLLESLGLGLTLGLLGL